MFNEKSRKNVRSVVLVYPRNSPDAARSYDKLCEPGEKRRANESGAAGRDRREDCEVFLRVWMFQSGGKDTLYSRPQSVRLELYILRPKNYDSRSLQIFRKKKKRECVQSARNVRRKSRDEKKRDRERLRNVKLCFSFSLFFFYNRAVINASWSWDVKFRVQRVVFCANAWRLSRARYV